MSGRKFNYSEESGKCILRCLYWAFIFIVVKIHIIEFTILICMIQLHLAYTSVVQPLPLIPEYFPHPEISWRQDHP